MRSRYYSAVYVQVMLGLLLLGSLLFLLTVHEPIVLPIGFDTVYTSLRSVLAVSFVCFFVLLMLRHLGLLVLSVADQIDRWTAARREDTDEPFTPLITIIVPVYNEEVVVEDSIRSLLTLDYPSYEVLVVDDGSSDDTLRRARSLEGDYEHARVTVLWKPNGGKSTALNFGVERAAGDFVLTMDGDSTLDVPTLRAAIRHMRDPDVGAVAGAVAVTNPVNFWSRLQELEYLKGLNLVRRAQGFIRAVSIVPGPIGVFRKSALRSVGLYAHDTFAEDCELTIRLLLDGWKICYEPAAVARTEVPEHLMDLIKQRYRWTRGILQALIKHSRRLLIPGGSLIGSFTLWYMFFEGVLWPLMSVLSLVFLGLAGFDVSLRAAAAYFWMQLLLLDIATTIYCLGIAQRSLALGLLAPVERLVFQILLDICRFLASLDEMFGLQMTWGKLKRKGRGA